MEFDLQPYVGAGPLRFGMPLQDIAAAFGDPSGSGKTRSGETRVQYPEFVLAIDTRGRLAEITFLPASKLYAGGVDLFRVSDPLVELQKVDSGPIEYVGILLFPKLGITLSGFHTPEEKTATAFARGRFDKLLPKFKPFKFGS